MLATDLAQFDAQPEELDAMREVLRQMLAAGAWVNWAHNLPTFEEFEAQVVTLNRWHPVFATLEHRKIVCERFVLVVARDVLAHSASRVAAGGDHDMRKTHAAPHGLLERMEAAR